MLTIQVACATPFKAKAKTKRIPAGTELELKMLNSVDTSISVAGSGFSAVLLSDQTADDDVILPSGSIVRGDVKGVILPRRMSKGAVLYLNFDQGLNKSFIQAPPHLL